MRGLVKLEDQFLSSLVCAFRKFDIFFGGIVQAAYKLHAALINPF